MLKFKPKDESELEREREERMKSLLPWPKGEYDFEVASAKDNPEKGYIELDVVIFNEHGEERHVTDWLTPKMMYKLMHFCDAAALMPEYEAGELSAHNCNGATGRCVVKVEKGRKKRDGDGFFEDQNRIADYCKRSAAIRQAIQPPRHIEEPVPNDLPWEEVIPD